MKYKKLVLVPFCILLGGMFFYQQVQAASVLDRFQAGIEWFSTLFGGGNREETAPIVTGKKQGDTISPQEFNKILDVLAGTKLPVGQLCGSGQFLKGYEADGTLNCSDRSVDTAIPFDTSYQVLVADAVKTREEDVILPGGVAETVTIPTAKRAGTSLTAREYNKVLALVKQNLQLLGKQCPTGEFLHGVSVTGELQCGAFGGSVNAVVLDNEEVVESALVTTPVDDKFTALGDDDAAITVEVVDEGKNSGEELSSGEINKVLDLIVRSESMIGSTCSADHYVTGFSEDGSLQCEEYVGSSTECLTFYRSGGGGDEEGGLSGWLLGGIGVGIGIQHRCETGCSLRRSALSGGAPVLGSFNLSIGSGRHATYCAEDGVLKVASLVPSSETMTGNAWSQTFVIHPDSGLAADDILVSCEASTNGVSEESSTHGLYGRKYDNCTIEPVPNSCDVSTLPTSTVGTWTLEGAPSSVNQAYSFNGALDASGTGQACSWGCEEGYEQNGNACVPEPSACDQCRSRLFTYYKSKPIGTDYNGNTGIFNSTFECDLNNMTFPYWFEPIPSGRDNVCAANDIGGYANGAYICSPDPLPTRIDLVNRPYHNGDVRKARTVDGFYCGVVSVDAVY